MEKMLSNSKGKGGNYRLIDKWTAYGDDFELYERVTGDGDNFKVLVGGEVIVYDKRPSRTYAEESWEDVKEAMAVEAYEIQREKDCAAYKAQCGNI